MKREQHRHENHNELHEQREHDHTTHHRMMIRDFRKRFYVTLIMSVPVLGLSELIQQFLGFHFTFTGDGLVVFTLATGIFIYGERPFLKGLVEELKKKSQGMMTLIGLAFPLVVAQSTAKSAQNGLIIRNRTAFENARRITTVVFDKTGTLARGKFEVSQVDVYDDAFTQPDIIAFAAALEGQSEHPIGKSIVVKAKEDGISTGSVDSFRAMKGKGVSGNVDGRQIQVVSPGYLDEQGLKRPSEARDRGGVTRVFLIVEGKVAGSIALSDTIRLESYEAVRVLQKQGIKCWMLTGDNNDTAKAVADELGMGGVFVGNTSP